METKLFREMFSLGPSSALYVHVIMPDCLSDVLFFISDVMTAVVINPIACFSNTFTHLN